MRRVFAVLLLSVATSPLAAQRIPAITLRPADAVHPHEFTSVGSVRELSDGRVIVTDGREQRLLLLDFQSGASHEIGRKGGGPSEYSIVTNVLAIGADSSIMTDFMARRWLLLHGGRIVETVPPDNAAVSATEALIQGADVLGRVLRRYDPPVASDGVTVRTAKDSFAVAFASRATGRVDTVARLRSAPRRLTRQTNREGRVISSSTMVTQLLPAEEAFVLFPDGALAIARLDPFRVDWLLPDGRWVRGDSLPVPKIPVTARERRAYEERNASNMATPTMPAGIPPLPERGYPDFVPPFPMGQGVFQGPNGMLLVRRTKSADFPDMTYLLIDRAARLVGTFTLSSREQVVGVGNGTLYTIIRDDDDIVKLRRHPWPTDARITGN